MDGYALKRAKALLRKVGIIRFHELMDELGKATTYGAQSTENRQESTTTPMKGLGPVNDVYPPHAGRWPTRAYPR